MYLPEHFKISDESEIFSFIDANAFGQLVSQHQGRLFSSQLPFLVSDDHRHLRCHLARQNPQWQEIEDQEVLIILSGADDYISPSWYENAGVPTWNYEVVHLYGTCRVFESKTQLKQLVEALTHKHES